MNQRWSRISWKSCAGSSLRRRFRGTAWIVGSNTPLSQSCATNSSSSFCRSAAARNESRSLSRRRAWFSCTSRPVSRSRRREWCPASTTFGWICTVVPSMSVVIASSSTSNPRLLRCSMRAATRHRSFASNDSDVVSASHSSS
ncbi:Uncharacterised protein [Mycobacteroides abscessus]|nr:Uncharacterised protein [Mycobacteroides abscessus]